MLHKSRRGIQKPCDLFFFCITGSVILWLKFDNSVETLDWNELLSYPLLTVAGVIGETRQAAIFIPGIVEIMVTRGVNIFVGFRHIRYCKVTIPLSEHKIVICTNFFLLLFNPGLFTIASSLFLYHLLFCFPAMGSMM